MYRRQALANIVDPPPSAHRGLWLDRYFADQVDQNGAADQADTAKAQHLERALKIAPPDDYAAFASALRAGLEELPHTRVLELTTRGRTIVGIGRATAWENSITLHHTWGVPVVPGSALKGLAASFAHQRLEDPAWRRRLDSKPKTQGGAWHNLLFGTTDERGLVCFHDALWVCAASEQTDSVQVSSEPVASKHDHRASTCGLHLDTITVHHPAYYQGKDQPPADWDAPTPIPFLSFSGKLVGAISWCGGAADIQAIDQWLDTAYAILEKALAEEGVGAKTSSGYGRMALKELLSEAARKQQELKKAVDEFVFPREAGEVNKIDTWIARLAASAQADTLFALVIDRVNHLSAAEAGIARNRIVVLAQQPEYAVLQARIPPEWRGRRTRRDPKAELAALKKELERLKATDPGKKPRKIKNHRDQCDRLEKKIAALEVEVDA